MSGIKYSLPSAHSNSKWLGLFPPFSRRGHRLGEVKCPALYPPGPFWQSRLPVANGWSRGLRGWEERAGTWAPALELLPLPPGRLSSSVGAGKQSWMLNKPPLNVSWKSQLCPWCLFLMSLIPSGLSISSSNSLLIWSQPLRFCDGNNGSGRWGTTTPVSFNVPSRRQGRHHLKRVGQIIKGMHSDKLPGLNGLWVHGGRRGMSSGRHGDGWAWGLTSTR